MIHLVSVLLGAAAGLVAFQVGLPLPWMLGPMIAATVVSSFGMRVAVPGFLPMLAMPVVGVMLGSRITSELLDQVGQFAFTLVVLVPFVAASGAASYHFYRRVGRFDPVTAYYAAMPGGLNDMMLLGAAAGGDERRIALAHAARVLCVIAFVALFFGLVLGVRSGSAGRAWTGFAEIGIVPGLWLLGTAVLGAPLGKALRLPAAPLLGAMILSGAVHVAGIVEVPPPDLAVIAAQVVLGLRIGGRFNGVPFQDIARDLGLGAVSSMLMIGVAVAFAWLVAQVTGTELSQAFLAFSPGGFVEMSLLALALGQEVAYVSFAHVARILLVIFGAPVMFGAVGVKGDG